MSRWPLTCERARILIIRTIDDQTLSAEARALLRQHLAVCLSCRDEYETQLDVRRLLALQIGDTLPAGFMDRLSARLAQEANRRAAHPELGTERSTVPLGTWTLTPPGDCNTRWRGQGLCLVVAAATLGLIVAGVRVRDPAPASGSSSSVASSSSEVGPSMDVELPTPRRRDASPRRRDLGPAPNDLPTLTHEAPAHRSGDSHASTSTDTISGIALMSPTDPPVPELPVELIAVTPRLAPELANELKLSDEQRTQIDEIYDMRQRALREILHSTRQRVELERSHTDAAIERVLTPDQRQEYRERCASMGSSVLIRPTTPPSSGQAAAPQIASAMCRE